MIIRRYFFLLILISLPSSVLFGQQQTKPRPKSIKATVVAENISNRLQSCWHVCGLTLLVRIDGRKSHEFAMVTVTYMHDRGLQTKGDHWKLIEKTGRWEFKVVLHEPGIAVLDKFATTKDLATGADITDRVQMNQWIPVKGSENEVFPFGESLASYSVGLGKFKSLE